MRCCSSYGREQEVQVDLKDSSSKNEELGYLMIKLKIESGMTSISQKTVKLQKVPRVSTYVVTQKFYKFISCLKLIFKILLPHSAF